VFAIVSGVPDGTGEAAVAEGVVVADVAVGAPSDPLLEVAPPSSPPQEARASSNAPAAAPRNLDTRRSRASGATFFQHPKRYRTADMTTPTQFLLFAAWSLPRTGLRRVAVSLLVGVAARKVSPINDAACDSLRRAAGAGVTTQTNLRQRSKTRGQVLDRGGRRAYCIEGPSLP
jgi:hypothetical protein